MEMTLQDFIRQFDKDGAIVLLEGKRKVLENDREKLSRLGRLLASSSAHITFRSGNASGADQYFAEGVAEVDKRRLQLITPYAGHRKKASQAYEVISLDSINLAEEADVIYQSKTNRATARLVDPFVAGEKNSFTIKAAYIIRDTIKVIGSSAIPPALFGIFYDDLQKPQKGGTGHTMHICRMNGIPLIDQRIWFKWLEASGMRCIGYL